MPMINRRGLIVVALVSVAWLAAADAQGSLTREAVLAAFRRASVVAGAVAPFGDAIYRLDKVDVSVHGEHRIIVTIDVTRVP